MEKRSLGLLNNFGIAAGCIATAFVLGLVALNFGDYYRYKRAISCGKTLGATGLQALVNSCAEGGKIGIRTVDDPRVPPVIRALNPTWLSLEKQYAQIGLYSHGEACVFLCIEMHNENQVVTLCDYVLGTNEGEDLWVLDPTKYRLLNPINRIVTLSESAMSETRDWIVLSNQILIVSRQGTGVAKIVGQKAISTSDREQIKAAMAAIKPYIKGNCYSSGTLDGIKLTARFSTDGRPSPSDVFLDNSVIEEMIPLIEAVSNRSPQGQQIEFVSTVRKMDHLFMGPAPQYVTTWAEQKKNGRIRLPWWCLWPRVVGSN